MRGAPASRDRSSAPEVERELLAAVVADPRGLVAAKAEELLPRHFADPAAGRVYSVLVRLGDGAADLALLRHEFAGDPEADRALVAAIGESVGNSASAGVYARIIREAATARALRVIGREIATTAEERGISADEQLRRASAAVSRVASESRSLRSELIGSDLGALFDRIEARGKGKGLVGLPTGFRELDQATLGLRRGDLVVLGARPGVGKTALALCIAGNVAVDQRRSVLFVSREMSRESLQERLVAARSGVAFRFVQAGRVDEGRPDREAAEAWRRMEEARAAIVPAKLYLTDRSGLTIEEISTHAESLSVREGRLDLVIVDYLQLVRTGARLESRYVEISYISAELKRLAKSLSTPILALAQLNREIERRQDRRPTMADLRDSGSIEQDADIVGLMYREDAGTTKVERPGVSELILAKNRHGETGTVELAHRLDHQRFYSRGEAPPVWRAA